MTEPRKAVVIVLTAVLTLVGCLVLEYVEIHDSTLRSSVTEATAILGAVIVAVLAMRGVIVALMAHVKARTPQHYQGTKNLGKVIALGLMSLAGCGFTLYVAFGGKQQHLEYAPLAIAVVFAGIATFCLRYIWRDWKAWERYRRLDTGQRKT
jgi:uncharacterized membrane protein YbhN (UPF0104 family)